MTALPTLSRWLLPLSLALACGRGVPEPWSERHGEQEIIVGNEGPGVPDRGRGGEGGAQPTAAQPTTTTRVTAPTPSSLPEVPERYPELEGGAPLTRCPEGTERVDKRATDHEVFCVLPGGTTRHGPYVSYWGNGQLHEVGGYRGGQRHGPWTEWFRNGKAAGTWQWDNGVPGAQVTAP